MVILLEFNHIPGKDRNVIPWLEQLNIVRKATCKSPRHSNQGQQCSCAGLLVAGPFPWMYSTAGLQWGIVAMDLKVLWGLQSWTRCLVWLCAPDTPKFPVNCPNAQSRREDVQETPRTGDSSQCCNCSFLRREGVWPCPAGIPQREI